MDMHIRLLWICTLDYYEYEHKIIIMGYEHYQMPKPPPAETSSMYVSKMIYLSVHQKGQYIISFYLLHPFPELETNNPTVFIQALVFNLCTCFLVYTTVNFVRYNFR